MTMEINIVLSGMEVHTYDNGAVEDVDAWKRS